MKARTGSSMSRSAWLPAALVMAILSTFTFGVAPAFAQAQESRSAESRNYLQLFQNIFLFVMRNHVDEQDPKALFEGAMRGMFEALDDPHSAFLDSGLMSDMNRTLEGSYAGIGLYISKETLRPGSPQDAPRYIEIVSPIEDTPGWRAGLQPGDLITTIDGESTAPMATDEASSKIRGEPGTDVRLGIRRGKGLAFEVVATRAVIQLPAIKQAVIPHAGRRYDYIRIIDWVPQTPEKLGEALRTIDKTGSAGLIVDVRGNPGGLLTSVIQASDLFLDSGLIVSTRGRNPSEEKEHRAGPDLAYPHDRPFVVLINRGSASASEIFAGAMKDARRALLVGEKTYGKGSVQQIVPLVDSGFRLTTSRYYTPSGGRIDKAGIPPDVPVQEPELDDAGVKALETVYSSGAIQTFADENPDATAEERNAFADRLAAENASLPPTLLRRLVRDEIQRRKIAPAFDLEFDIQLRAALDLLGDPGFRAKLSGAPTVREMVPSTASSP